MLLRRYERRNSSERSALTISTRPSSWARPTALGVEVTARHTAIVAVTARCASSHGYQRNPMLRTDCREAIEAFVSGDPARLRGLPPGCTLADLEVKDGWLRGQLGETISTPVIRELREGKLVAR